MCETAGSQSTIDKLNTNCFKFKIFSFFFFFFNFMYGREESRVARKTFRRVSRCSVQFQQDFFLFWLGKTNSSVAIRREKGSTRL